MVMNGKRPWRIGSVVSPHAYAQGRRRLEEACGYRLREDALAWSWIGGSLKHCDLGDLVSSVSCKQQPLHPLSPHLQTPNPSSSFEMARNSDIAPYVGRLSRTQAFQKKGGYKTTTRKPTAAKAEEVPETKTKELKKGGKRVIPVNKASRLYPAEDVKAPKASRKSNKTAALRSSIQPGSVLILLAGRFRGKRVVFLKQLESGLLLVTGPFKVNGVPIRRVNQAYVIATSTKVDISSVNVDAKINDAYFRREKIAGEKPEASFFADPANKKAHPDSKVADQKALDKAVIAAIKKEGPVLSKYLASTFSLSNGDKPHAMRF
ncbi:unnamed protein product [Sympodiomycopsis kandeliae]